MNRVRLEVQLPTPEREEFPGPHPCPDGGDDHRTQVRPLAAQMLDHSFALGLRPVEDAVLRRFEITGPTHRVRFHQPPFLRQGEDFREHAEFNQHCRVSARALVRLARAHGSLQPPLLKIEHVLLPDRSQPPPSEQTADVLADPLGPFVRLLRPAVRAGMGQVIPVNELAERQVSAFARRQIARVGKLLFEFPVPALSLLLCGSLGERFPVAITDLDDVAPAFLPLVNPLPFDYCHLLLLPWQPSPEKSGGSLRRAPPGREPHDASLRVVFAVAPVNIVSTEKRPVDFQTA
ncbi:MAG: hypothetical protein U0Z53_28900 [Blastocatellia bacterium]